MATYNLNLQDRFFNYIKNGTKRIELRLYDEKRQKIQLNDDLVFANSKGEQLTAKVIGLLRYNNFDDLFKDFDIDIMADKSMTKEDLMSALCEFYTSEKQAKYGVIGLRIQLRD